VTDDEARQAHVGHDHEEQRVHQRLLSISTGSGSICGPPLP
jgi:hypothetical protein